VKAIKGIFKFIKFIFKSIGKFLKFIWWKLKFIYSLWNVAKAGAIVFAVLFIYQNLDMIFDRIDYYVSLISWLEDAPK
jgi:hypothetical protein|tara:strand:+ start:79 stop:312 length:234 start_codon:yes stop_codon:yes gene_type:complete